MFRELRYATEQLGFAAAAPQEGIPLRELIRE